MEKKMETAIVYWGSRKLGFEPCLAFLALSQGEQELAQGPEKELET